MSSGAYNSIKQGLAEAIGFAQGKPTGARVHRVEVPQIDVTAHPELVEGSTSAPVSRKRRSRRASG